MIRSITHKPPYIFLKTATISIAISRYIAMQLPPLSFYDTHRHCHIALHGAPNGSVNTTRSATTA
jgi:hypothetical protein